MRDMLPNHMLYIFSFRPYLSKLWVGDFIFTICYFYHGASRISRAILAPSLLRWLSCAHPSLSIVLNSPTHLILWNFISQQVQELMRFSTPRFAVFVGPPIPSWSICVPHRVSCWTCWHFHYFLYFDIFRPPSSFSHLLLPFLHILHLFPLLLSIASIAASWSVSSAPLTSPFVRRVSLFLRFFPSDSLVFSSWGPTSPNCFPPSQLPTSSPRTFSSATWLPIPASLLCLLVFPPCLDSQKLIPSHFLLFAYCPHVENAIHLPPLLLILQLARHLLLSCSFDVSSVLFRPVPAISSFPQSFRRHPFIFLHYPDAQSFVRRRNSFLSWFSCFPYALFIFGRVFPPRPFCLLSSTSFKPVYLFYQYFLFTISLR